MVQKKYDYLVFIGRFQPLHIGHLEVIDRARELADKVIILVGSSFQPRTPKNPFTYVERRNMIQEALGIDAADWVIIRPLRDKPYNDQKWANQVQQEVARCLPWSNMPLKGGIIGHRKDDSSFYLDLFPQWGAPIDHGINELVHATDIRELYFESSIKFLNTVVPDLVLVEMAQFKDTDAYADLVKEHNIIKKYRAAWKSAPYDVIFQTGDAVVVQSGHILLVRRGGYPGKGLMALPGGFINVRERVVDGILRELREETKLKLPEKVLRGSIQKVELFDAVDRSLRGRTITHAALIELPPGPLPPVKGSDDAEKAFWLPLSAIREEDLFEDHYHIIDQLVGGLA
jgi:bifunctional NMN adenylyltransferase/nudix hydrolase